jgi:methylmalonyl-CoA/ethylmalonyl-CoA epimerase
MRLKRIDHVGVIVDDLEEARDMLRSLGLEEATTLDREDLEAGFFPCGDTSIELIGIRDPEQRGRRLPTGQAARIEHIAFEVDDLEDALRALEALGVRPDAPPREVLGSLTFWTDAETSDGVRYQFVQKGAARGP